MVLIPLYRELHFYAVHRLIHWPPLYRTIHSLHHRNTNPSPWSGLSMHPLEHVLYFSAVVLHWVVPSHPIHAMYTLFHLAMAPVPGHSGFDRFEVGEPLGRHERLRALPPPQVLRGQLCRRQRSRSIGGSARSTMAHPKRTRR